MKISYNWLKWYIPEIPNADKLVDIFNNYLCEVESMEKKGEDDVFDLHILPDRAHDLLSHQGVARELASLFNIKFVDPTPKYKIPESKPTTLKIEIESDKCRRYMGRIVRNVKVGPSPDWVVKHLESVGQRSINNMVDAANIVMFDCGQPTHVFDLNKVSEKLMVRFAKDGEELTTLDNKECKLKSSNLVIADTKNVLAIAGVKGGKIAEVDNNTKDIILEVANFDPTSVRKTAQTVNIFTDAKKRFENDLSPELAEYGMLELSATILEMCPEAIFEDIVDVYPKKQEVRKLSFSADKISKILGLDVTVAEIKDILERYNFEFIPPDNGDAKGLFQITVPFMRLDLNIEEDMAEEVGRILGYDKIKPILSKINFTSKVNETYEKINSARNKLLADGYNEVMTYAFRDKGEVEVLASASDKKFLRTNLTDGLKESLKLNQMNSPILGMNEIKIFEIGTIFKKDKEEMHVAYANKKEIKEMKLDEFAGEGNPPLLSEEGVGGGDSKFKMWSLFPFISRDISVWVLDEKDYSDLLTLITATALELGSALKVSLVHNNVQLIDEFKKDGKTSFAFRMVFQSFDRTLTDTEVNDIMTKITNKIKDKDGWQVR